METRTIRTAEANQGRSCKTCDSPHREEIDAVLRGETGEEISGRELARRYDLTEASVRRHRQAGHHLEDAAERVEALDEDERGHDAGPDPRVVAEQRLRAEEEASRDRRLQALEDEERRRRQEEADAAERARSCARAAATAERLAVRRGELEDQAEDLLARLDATCAELQDLDGRHLRAIREAGRKIPTDHNLAHTLRRWLRMRSSTLTQTARTPHDDHGNRPLREIDRLAARAAHEEEAS